MVTYYAECFVTLNSIYVLGRMQTSGFHKRRHTRIFNQKCALIQRLTFLKNFARSISMVSPGIIERENLKNITGH